MRSIVTFLFFIIPTISSLDCNGPADIVIAVPGSETVPQSEFQHLENFLIDLVSYYSISETNTRIGLVLYGREPVVIAELEDAPTKQATNARITILSQRQSFLHQISGGQNVPKAIEKVHQMLSDGRPDVPKIGVVLTYGNADLTSSDQSVVAAQVGSTAKSALDDGIALFAVSTGGTVPGFPDITRDTCRLFSLGSYDGLNVLLPFLGSATCYVLDPQVNPEVPNCFPEIIQPPTTRAPFQCGFDYTLLPDPENCAYYYWCPLGIRFPCGEGKLYDPAISRCNHQKSVTCYSGLSCPAAKGLFPHPTDCSKFLSCSQNIPNIVNCPVGLWFNPFEEYCDHRKNVVCVTASQNPDDLINRVSP